MFRKVAAIVFLLALVAGAIWLSRWIEHRDDLQVTVVFDSSTGLTRGSDVVAEGLAIGKVTKVSELESQEAVSFRVDSAYRNEVLRDSLFSIEGDSGARRLEVMNAVAIGKPLEDGAVIYARNDKIARWIAKHGKKLGPLVHDLGEKAKDLMRNYESSDFAKQLEQWKGRLPEWKEEGAETVEKNLGKVEREVADLEADLRKARKNVEADKIRAQFESWVQNVRESLSREEKAPATTPAASQTTS